MSAAKPIRLRNERRVPLTRRITFGAAVVALALSIAGAAHASGFDDARRISEMADTPDFPGRLEICRSILGGAPVPWARAFCEGYAALAGGNEAVAKTSLEEALGERSNFALGAILYGDLAAEQDRLETAAVFYNRALVAQPERTDARFALGSVFFRLGQERDPSYYPQALEAFRLVAEANPKLPNGWSHMALVLGNMGRFADAEAMYRKAIERSPEDPFLYDGLASLYARQDRNEPAEENWRHALALNPGYGPAVIELAALYARTGRLEKGLAVLENAREAAKVAPWGARIRRNLAFAYLRIGMDDAARARFEEAVHIGGDALSELGVAHLRMAAGDEAGALTAFESGAVLDSALASPFVAAWREPLSAAANSAATPALRRVLDGLDKPRPGRDGKVAAPPVPKDLRGAAATSALADFVLEGWSFADAATVKEKLGSSPSDSLGNQYDTPPVPLKQVPAEYPESAEAAGLTGTVQILVMVDEKGTVVDARQKVCDAPNMLCEAAVTAAKKWTFKPATRYGQPVKASVLVPFRFRAPGQ
jgi:TonB family protein